MRIVLIWLAFCFGVHAAIAEVLPEPTGHDTYLAVDSEKVRLGRFLFYDRVLSGSYRVSCATCHNHDRGSSNGYRTDGKPEPDFDELATNGISPWAPFQPSSRHAPSLFNLGAREFTTLFSDGRVRLKNGKLVTPAHAALPINIESVLAAQALFPTITRDELTGEAGSDVSDPAMQSNQAIWDALVLRIADLPDYAPLFTAAFDDVESLADIRIDHIANALAAFVASEWSSDDAPFDRYLRGDKAALSVQQKNGMTLFYGKSGCATCHAGIFQTDHDFHRTGVTSSGDGGMAETGDAPRWQGLFNVTQMGADLGRIRTPSLRNVARTAPYGLAGQYETLAAVTKAHKSIGASHDSGEMTDLIAFLESLTDDSAIKGRLGKPDDVPSSLALD